MNSNEMNNVTVIVKIDNDNCLYSDVILRQSIYGHHTFELNLNYNSTDTNIWQKTPQFFIKKYLGSRIVIEMSERVSKETNEFRGIVTSVEIKGKDGDHGSIKLIGGSPTLLLDSNPTMDSYVDFKLDIIIKSVLSEINTFIDTKFDIQNATSKIPYACRYNEGGYNFLHRLCSSLGEWLFYDGKKLVAGFAPNPKSEKYPRLVYNEDFSVVNSSASIETFESVQYDYDYILDNNHYISAMNDMASTYMHIAKKKSKALNKAVRYRRDMFPMHNELHGLLLPSVEAAEGRIFSGSAIFEGESKSCQIRIGGLILTVLQDKITDTDKDMGFLRVIEVIHTFNEKHSYSNTFKGMTASTLGMPMGDTTQPIAYPETATVVDNNDPDKMGRVKVKFAWQSIHEKTDLTSNWIRVQTPDAGSSETVSTNRGLFFIPEIGDQVMIGFELGSPERPFVMGSMFHKNNAGGASEENTIRSIITKSGHTLEFNDDEGGAWGITIKDANGCSIHIDTKGKNIEITALETMTLTAKNVSINAEENVQIAAKKNIDIAAEADINSVAKGNLSQQADGDASIAAKGNVNIEATSDATIAGQNATVDGKAKATINGGQTLVAGKMTRVQGGAHKFDIM